jgi:hypothetical protein
VHDAVFVHDLARGDHGIAVHDDADEAVVLIDAQLQNRQAGLKRDGERDAIGDDEALRAGELLAIEKQAGHAA